MATFYGATELRQDRDSAPSTLKLWAVRLLTCVSAAAEGYDIGVMGGVLVLVGEDFSMTKMHIALLTGLFSVAVACGALIGGPLADSFGRKTALAVTYMALVIGALVMASAQTLDILIWGRCIQGLSVGGAFCVVGAYMCEMAPAKRRGIFISLEAVFLNVGIFLGMAANKLLHGSTGSRSNDWRLMIAMAGVLPFICLVAITVLPRSVIPESPRWLQLQGEQEEAEAILRETLPPDEVEDVLQSWKLGGKADVATWSEMFYPATASERRSLWQGISVGVLQTACGIGVLIIYSSYILSSSMSKEDSFTGMVFVAASKLFVLILTVPLLDTVGRKPMLILSSGMMSAWTAALAASFIFETPPWMKLVALGGSISSFGLGLGGGAYVVMAEVFPSRMRAKGSAMAFFFSRMVSALTTITFPFVSDMISVGGTFLIYSFVTAVGCVFVATCIEETKGLTLEQLDKQRQDTAANVNSATPA